MIRCKKNYSHKLLAFNSLMFLLIVYFLYHSLSGDRGLFAFIKLQKKISEQNITLNTLEEERKILEKKVISLNPKTLDKDVLEEISRNELGLVADDEKIIVLEKKVM
jgi:cell division protein FtsB